MAYPSHFSGDCQNCDNKIERGMMVTTQGVGNWVHSDCNDHWQGGVGRRGRFGAKERAKRSPLIAEWEANRKMNPVRIDVEVDKPIVHVGKQQPTYRMSGVDYLTGRKEYR